MPYNIFCVPLLRQAGPPPTPPFFVKTRPIKVHRNVNENTARTAFARWREGAGAETFSALFGALLGLSLLKFGNPVVMEKFITSPQGFYDWLISPWPLAIGYWLLLPVAVLGVLVARGEGTAPGWLLLLPLIWLGWQIVAATRTIDPQLTHAALVQYGSCVTCFYLGYFSLARASNYRPFWLGLFGALAVVLASGFQQHFGGLAESRRYFFAYVYPHWKTVPAEYLKRVTDNRIFSTLFYPNTLAEALLLLTPPLLVVLWRAGAFWKAPARKAAVGLAGVACLLCLYWSGSKGGWLLMLVMSMIALLRLPFQRRLKVALVIIVLILGPTGFALKYAGYFKKGATSLGARFDCWQAVGQIVESHPWVGTGPGTFGVIYQQIKRPDAEMARMAHNDYLEQASGSGLPGFAIYLAFIVGALAWSGRRLLTVRDAGLFAIWLGLSGWSLHESLEFGLYIPAIGWTAFGLLGWLLKSLGNQFDSGVGES